MIRTSFTPLEASTVAQFIDETGGRARKIASWATSSASAVLRKTPRATRKASGPHSARRSSKFAAQGRASVALR